MHGQVAWTYLLQRTLTSWDVSFIPMHCYISGSSTPLVHILQSLLTACEEVWRTIAEACDICAALGLDPDDFMPFHRTVNLFIFRIFQYYTASQTNANLAMRIATKLDEEFESASDNDTTSFFRFLFLSQLLSQTNVRYPMSVVIIRAEELLRVAAMEASPPQLTGENDRSRDTDIPKDGYAQFVGLRLISHYRMWKASTNWCRPSARSRQKARERCSN